VRNLSWAWRACGVYSSGRKEKGRAVRNLSWACTIIIINSSIIIIIVIIIIM